MTTTELQEIVSKAERRRYVAKIKRAQRAIGRLEDRAVRSLIRDLEAARRSLQSALVDATQFGQWHLPHVLQAIDEALEEFRQAAPRKLAVDLEGAWDLGDKRVSDLAAEAGIQAEVPVFKFGIPRDQLELAQGWSADLIRAEADSVVKAVSKEIRLGFASGATKEELIRRVQDHVTKPLRFKSFRKRAETIVRTEVNRVHNAAAQARREQLGAENVIVRKQWISSGKGSRRERKNHAAMNGQVVDADKPFEMISSRTGRILKPMYPQDPVLPAEESINCGCAAVEVFEVMEEEAVEIAAEVGA